MKRGILTSICLSLSFITAVYSQDTTNTIGRVSISSPTAASLGKFGDIPVSYHTGLPQIDIPIYTVEAGQVKIPISISYHASGLRVQENASWVGAGWALNAGGCITRTVVGAPDDRGHTNTGNVIAGYYSDFGFNSYLNAGPNNTGYPDDKSFVQGMKDGQPDLFFFNFGSYSGKFYFNDDRTPILVPEADFKIQPDFLLGPGFQGFIITTPDGIKYYFGHTGNNSSIDPIEITISSTISNGMASNQAASSWFLNKVVSADGMDSVTLTYATENYSFYQVSLYPIAGASYIWPSGTPANTGTDLAKNFVSGVRLSSITFPNGTISFTPSATARQDLSGGTNLTSTFNDINNNNSFSLGSISIANNSGFCKKDTFYYSYFFDNTALSGKLYPFYSSYNLHTDEYKLRLDSVGEFSCDASLKIPPYKFSYFSERVPRRLTTGIDHWGYYNGMDSNQVYVQSFTVNTGGVPALFNGANRDAVWPTMRGGSLNKITYPTGGSTSFDFEAKSSATASYSQYVNVPLVQMVINEGGQDDDSSVLTSFFTIDNGGGQYTLNIVNTANYFPTVKIVDGTGTSVFYQQMSVSPMIQTGTLPPGPYWITVDYHEPIGLIVGGLTSNFYQYQWRNFSFPVSVSGLRIKTITTNDGMSPNNNIVTSYTYPGGGVIYSFPTYVQVLRNDNMALVWPYCSPNGCTSCDSWGAHTYFVSPSSIRPMANVQGENVAYNEVDVTQAGNGHSVYQYYGTNMQYYNPTDVCVRILNQSVTCDPSIPNFPAPPVPNDFMRDELSYEAHFNQNGQVLKETYYYPVYSLDPLKTQGHIAVNIPGMYSYTEYSLQSAKKIQSQTVETIHDPSSGTAISTTNTVYFGSLFHHQPTRNVVSTSTGDSLATNSTYAMDYRIASCDIIPDSLTYYNSLIYSDSLAMLGSINSCSPQANDGTNCRISIDTAYREQLVRARMNFIRYRRHYFAPDSANIPSQCYLAALPSADTILKPILRLQNCYQNPVIEQSSWKDLNLLHATFTRYDTSLNPIGFAYPERTKLINLQAPSSTFAASAVSGITITKDSRYIDESFFNFGKGRPLQILGKDGTPISYIWDYLNTTPIAKVGNATSDQVAFTSFEADGQGGWTYSGTPSTDPSSMTGSKDYVLNGSNNVTKTGLSTTKSFVVSYWSKSSSASVNGSTTTSLVSKRGWSYYEHIVPAGNSSVSVSGNVTIDNLRLYPTDAQMTSYTYSPMVGMTTSEDVGNQISYYQYDNLGRLLIVMDQDGNIIKTLRYHYAGIATP
jgi:hypothetical protein